LRACHQLPAYCYCHRPGSAGVLRGELQKAGEAKAALRRELAAEQLSAQVAPASHTSAYNHAGRSAKLSLRCVTNGVSKRTTEGIYVQMKPYFTPVCGRAVTQRLIVARGRQSPAPGLIFTKQLRLELEREAWKKRRGNCRSRQLMVCGAAAGGDNQSHCGAGGTRAAGAGGGAAVGGHRAPGSGHAPAAGGL
jgi:hypothetical protein